MSPVTAPRTSGSHQTRSGVSFADWTGKRTPTSWGTNFGTPRLAFQGWHHFKEAFAPELVARAIREHPQPVVRCVDPFAGSGTTALACQFLGVQPLAIEVNPYLADLIEAKVASYDTDALARDLGIVVSRASTLSADAEPRLTGLPETFVEPGLKGRWIFDREAARQIAGILSAIESLVDSDHRRLFRVLLGGVLIDVSNVVINGKGRRYRGAWETRRRAADAAMDLFRVAVQEAIGDIHQYSRRPCVTYDVRRGDCLELLRDLPSCELAVFSPPYPNSFDYTDVYNVELWMLGYLTDSASNHRLRASTIASHVQITRAFAAAPDGSPALEAALTALSSRAERLWDRRIPAMIGAYFSDIAAVLRQLHGVIVEGGRTWMVLGDSRYAGVNVPTAAVVADLAPATGWSVEACEPCRSMRVSPQQGGRAELAESLLILSRC